MERQEDHACKCTIEVQGSCDVIQRTVCCVKYAFQYAKNKEITSYDPE